MNRRNFVKHTGLLGAHLLLSNPPSFSMNERQDIATLNGQFCGTPITIHALPTGWVKVKRSHKGPGLGMPQILLDFRWTEWMPIYSWLIEHPEGNLLIDTGENTQVMQDGYFACDPTVGWVNKQILQFNLTAQDEVTSYLRQLSYSHEDIRWLVLTHLHLDHVDGLHHFPRTEILVNQVEYQNRLFIYPLMTLNREKGS
ncbi:MAG: MBL fold metallo-hydrolase [Bacteroidota bacterium]